MGESLPVHEPGSLEVHAVVSDRNMYPRCGKGAGVCKFMPPKDLVSESAEGFASIVVPYRSSVIIFINLFLVKRVFH